MNFSWQFLTRLLTPLVLSLVPSLFSLKRLTLGFVFLQIYLFRSAWRLQALTRTPNSVSSRSEEAAGLSCAPFGGGSPAAEDGGRSLVASGSLGSLVARCSVRHGGHGGSRTRGERGSCAEQGAVAQTKQLNGVIQLPPTSFHGTIWLPRRFLLGSGQFSGTRKRLWNLA